MHPEQAEDQVALIRTVLERTAKFTGLPGAACLIAGGLAVAGAGAAWALGAEFTSERAYEGPPGLLAAIWIATALASLVEIIVLSVLAARRQNRPAWTSLVRRVIVATLPGLYLGLALGEFARRSGRLDALPALWCLAYGASLLGLGLYAGWKANLAGLLFLAAGTLALLGVLPGGNLLMAIAFGGIHILLGILILGGSAHETQDRID
jgi:hypothetical protein